MLHDDIQALYTVFEWTGLDSSDGANHNLLPQYIDHINQAKNWRRISAISSLFSAFNEDNNYSSEAILLTDLPYAKREDLLQQIDQLHINPNRLKHSQIEHILTGGWPLIVATDGGATSDTSNNTTHCYASAGIVILQPPNISFEAYSNATKQQQDHILNNNLLPWRARATPLPPCIGDQIIDNAHAECMAIILMEEWLPRGVPVLLLMDSEAERSRYHELRHPRKCPQSQKA